MKKSILTMTAICAFSIIAGISDANAHSYHHHHHTKHKQVVVIKKKPVVKHKHVVVTPKRIVRHHPKSLFSFNIKL